VDDDPDISRTIELHLGRFNVEVRRAFFGMHGLWEALHAVPDLILLDVSMPQGDGPCVLECLKRNPQLSGIPVIVLTGIRDRHLRRRMYRMGAEQFLCKPIAFENLLHEINRYVNLRDRGETCHETLAHRETHTAPAPA
jgi:DNA-binding response OmpR family regulator